MKTKNSELVDIDVKDYSNDPDKIDFFGIYADPECNIKLKRSTNLKKVNELLTALKSRLCWEKSVCQDSNLPYYAMTAYLENKISREQISHILDFHELKSTYPSAITLPLLNETGEFTIQVHDIMSRIIATKRYKLPRITNDHIEKFRIELLEYLKVKTNYLSAAVFHLIPKVDSGTNYDGITTMVGAIFNTDVGTIIFPEPVRNLFFPSITPNESTKVISQGKLGPFSIHDIEVKQRKKIRLNAKTVDDAYRTTHIHMTDTIGADAGNHDSEHQGASSYFPKKLYDAVLFAVDVIREKTKIYNSRDSWRLIDGYFIGPDISVLAHKEDKIYKTTESLTIEEGYIWFRNFISGPFNSYILYVVLDHVQKNPEKWHPYIDVTKFFEMVDNETKTIFQPKTIDEIFKRADTERQLFLGFLLEWSCVKNSKLFTYLTISKNINNDISLFILDEPYAELSHKDLCQELLQPNSILPSLLTAVMRNDQITLSFLLADSFPDRLKCYLPIALRIAATKGHLEIVKILEIEVFKKGLLYYGHYLITETVRAGHQDIATIILDNENVFVGSGLHAAIRYNRLELFAHLLKHFESKIPTEVIVEAIALSFNLNKGNFLEKIGEYIQKQSLIAEPGKNSFTETILNDLHVNALRLHNFKESIKALVKIIPFHHPLMMKLAFGIAKSGNVNLFKFLVEHLQTNQYLNKKDDCHSLLSYLLHTLTTSKGALLHSGNLHHPIVAYQIDTYLQLSSQLNVLDGQGDLPRLFDLNELITKVFTEHCELGLHYLLKHDLINSNPSLKEYCLNSCQKIFFTNCELEFEYVGISHKDQLYSIAEKFRESVTDDLSKIILVEDLSASKAKKWHIIYKLKNQDITNMQVSTQHNNTELSSYLTYLFTRECLMIPIQLTNLKSALGRHIKFPCKETYYLRKLLASGLKLDFSFTEDEVIIDNSIHLNKIVSLGNQCLLWLAVAIYELQQPNIDSKRLQGCLTKATKFEEFRRELILLIYGKSMPINIHILRMLKDHFDTNTENEKYAISLLDERITFLKESVSDINNFNNLKSSIPDNNSKEEQLSSFACV